jgi:WD40 repeat protein
MIGSYNAPIRDMCVSSHNGPSNLICITGNDKVASIFSGRTGQNVMKLSLGHHTGWSCCFDEANSSLIWVGASSGMIMLFDIRKMGGRVVSPTCPYDGSCLAAYQLAPDQPETNFFENIPNLIPKMSTQIYNIQMGYPPIQSLLHSRTDSNSICDHLMVCQGGRGRFLHLGGQLNTLNSSDICLPAGIPMSVYDIQRCVRPGSDIHAPCHYVLACRSHFLSAEQNKNLISPQPAFRTISFDPSMQRSLPNHSLPPHHKEMSSWRFDEGMTFTGHSASTSGAKPHSAFVGSQFMKSLLGAEYDETNKSLDSGLMIACPDEAHHGVLVSVAGGREIRKIGV